MLLVGDEVGLVVAAEKVLLVVALALVMVGLVAALVCTCNPMLAGIGRILLPPSRLPPLLLLGTVDDAVVGTLWL